MKFFHASFAALCLLVCTGPTFAAKKASRKKAPEPAYDLMATKPLNEVLARAEKTPQKIKSPSARALKKADDQLQAKRYAGARASATAALADPLFSDYAHWILATAAEREAEAQLATKKSQLSTALARQAFENFQAVQTGSPYSPLQKQNPKDLGESELLLGQSLSPTKDSVRHFQNSFERLTNVPGALAAIGPEQILSYAKACAKNGNDLCEPWLFRLTEKSGRDTPELKAVVKLFPNVADHPRTATAAIHSTQPYHAPDLDVVAFEDAMSSILSSKWSETLVKLRKFLDEFPKSGFRYRARYWLARAEMETRKRDESLKEWQSLQDESPMSYYGLLSAFAASSKMERPLTGSSPLAAERDPALSAPEIFHLKRAETLIAEKAYDLAGAELRELRPRGALSSAFLAYVAGLSYQSRNYAPLMTLLTELIQRGYEGISSELVMKMIFPVAHWERIKKYASENEIDPVLVLSLIKQESAFDLHAMSGSGATGLMQIMYFTAVETAPGVSRMDLLEAEHNVRVGTRYLSRLLNRYHGNIVLSLAAYNAGPAAVDRWLKEGSREKYGMLEFIESIPYRETREYVSSIVRNYFWYSKILGQPMPATLAFFWKPHGELSHDIGGPDVPASTAASSK